MARFRIRTKEGQELSFASHEVFAEFVRSGDLSPDDVVYDAASREWSSALTHPVVLQIQLEAEGGSAGPVEVDTALPDAPDAPEVPDVDDLGLDLSPATSALTPEQEAAAFVAKMEAERATERATERDFDPAPPSSLNLERTPSGMVEELAVPARPERPRSPAELLGREPEPRRRAPTAAAAPPKRKPAKRLGRLGRYAPFAILGLVAVAGLVYFGPDLLAPATGEGNEAGPEVVVEPAPTAPVIADTEESLRARARERFLTSTQAALRGLPPIPDIWLRGSYLAAPSEYPDVPDVWRQYLDTVREVRAADVDRYREAYLRALDDARVEGGARTLRLTGAVTAFEAAGARRAAHWDRVESLATAALRGHDALVRAEGTIMYQPATGPALSADPIIEAVGRSPEAQALLNQVLDMMLRELHSQNGPDEVANVREWVWDGFLDAVTS